MARQRQFEETDVLDRAMDVFWTLGYEGASLAELTRAMGVTAPSIYSAFGNKRGLFDAVLERYAARRIHYLEWVFAARTAYEVAERTLLGAVDWMTDPNEPLGCLSIQAGLSAGAANVEVPKLLSDKRDRMEARLRERFEQARAQGDLQATDDPALLARFVQTLFLGLGVQAAAGRSRDELIAVVMFSLRSWPGKTG